MERCDIGGMSRVVLSVVSVSSSKYGDPLVGLIVTGVSTVSASSSFGARREWAVCDVGFRLILMMAGS